MYRSTGLSLRFHKAIQPNRMRAAAKSAMLFVSLTLIGMKCSEGSNINNTLTW